MAKHSHRFVEEYDGFLGFGLNREVDGKTLTCYLQKFSDDQLMTLLRSRMSSEDMDTLSDLLIHLMKKYLTDEEYHRYFLKDDEES